ncbi:ROK family transcriptional regulator [Harryflintia acetispora]|uniref:ROK family transcriptional regulator n=1 Tax=Harryflintia acetispora TaxID=1849041 RepID=UPI0018983B03|nr:ROK family transcriptional regulator [Harryflintia acetispora]
MIQPTQDQAYTKIHNTRVVLDLIREKRPLSRVEIARLTGMSSATITRIVSDLIRIGVVCETTPFSTKVGRKAILLDIVSDAALCFAVDIAPSLLRAGIVDYKGEVLCQREYAIVCREHTPQQYAKLVHKSLLELCAALPGEKEVVCAGATVIGIVDHAAGMVRFAPQLGWKEVPIAALLEEALSLPVAIHNDVDAQILGEAQSLGLDKKSVAYLSVGKGVGSSMLLDGRVVEGDSDICGEIGHTIIELQGLQCSCGRRGCLQTFIGENSVLQRARMKDPAIKSMRQLVACYHEGTPWARELIEQTATYLAVAINNLGCMHNPQTIILGGELIRSYPFLFELAQQHLGDLLYEPLRGNLQLLCTKSRGMSGILGIAQLSQERYVDQLIEDNIF